MSWASDRGPWLALGAKMIGPKNPAGPLVGQPLTIADRHHCPREECDDFTFSERAVTRRDSVDCDAKRLHQRLPRKTRPDALLEVWIPRLMLDRHVGLLFRLANASDEPRRSRSGRRRLHRNVSHHAVSGESHRLTATVS